MPIPVALLAGRVAAVQGARWVARDFVRNPGRYRRGAAGVRKFTARRPVQGDARLGPPTRGERARAATNKVAAGVEVAATGVTVARKVRSVLPGPGSRPGTPVLSGRHGSPTPAARQGDRQRAA